MWRRQSYTPIVDPSTEPSNSCSYLHTCCCSSNTLVRCFERCLACLYYIVSNLLSAVFRLLYWCYKRWFYPTVFSQLVSSDLRIVFIMVAVYTSLVAHFSSTAAIEAERDVASRRNFTVNVNWTNQEVSGGISDPVLWGCRRYSDTKHYYRVLYGVLLCSYLIALIVYMLTRCIVSWLSFTAYCQLEDSEDGKDYLLYVANSLKKILSFQHMLEHPPSDGKIKRENLVDISNHWKQHSASPKSKRWVLFVFYCIPILETVLSLLVVIAIILSYDLHPMVCLSGIFRSEIASIMYNPVHHSVVLLFPYWATVFQKTIITVSVGFFLAFVALKTVEEHIQRNKM